MVMMGHNSTRYQPWIEGLGYASVKSRFEDLGAVPKGSTPSELAAFLQSEIAKWGPVIREAKIRVEN